MSASSRHFVAISRCPLYPRKRTLLSAIRVSALCPLTDIGTPRRLGVHQIDRTKKIHLADVDATVAEDGVRHRDVEKSVRDCHLQQVVLTADDLAGRPG